MNEADKIGACQWRYALVDGVKTDILDATKGVPGICPLCHEELRPRQGEQRGWHWYHKNGRKCDDWYEPKGAWHRWWQGNFKTEWQEVSIRKEIGGEEKKHIADVRTDENIVIEFQYSHLSDASIRAREEFYGNMVWVVNGTRLEKDKKYGDLLANNGRFTNTGGDLDWGKALSRKVIHTTWGKSRKLVFWDFNGTFENPKESGYLYCAIPERTIDRAVILVRVEKENFIECAKDGRLGKLIQQVFACKEQYDEAIREANKESEDDEENREYVEETNRDETINENIDVGSIVYEDQEEISKRRMEEESARIRQHNEQINFLKWKEELNNPARFALDCGWVDAILIIRNKLKTIDLKVYNASTDGLLTELPNSGTMALHLKKNYTKEEYERECISAKTERTGCRFIDFPKYERLQKCAGCIVGKFEYAKDYTGDYDDNSMAIANITPLHNYDDKIRFVWHVADRNGIWPLTDALIEAVNDRKYKQTKMPSCPVCGSKMVVKTRKTDGTKFLGCTKFPQCKEAFSLDENGIASRLSSFLYWKYLVGRDLL